MFYEDGTECSTASFNDPSDAGNMLRSTPAATGYAQMNWGRYRVDGDTIKVQSAFQLEAFRTVIGEDWYLINKDNTITYIAEYCRQARNKNFFDSRGFSTIIGPPTTYSFIPFPTKPDSMSSTLRGKKWYKCK